MFNPILPGDKELRLVCIECLVRDADLDQS
jgi:hypothetical protein